jgi:hypothetical protein
MSLASAARGGFINLRSEAHFAGALRPDTPLPFSWKVIQAQGTVARGYRPDATEQTLVA